MSPRDLAVSASTAMEFQVHASMATAIDHHGYSAWSPWLSSITSEGTLIIKQGLHKTTDLTFLLLEMFIVNCFQRGPFKTSGNLPHLCPYTPDFPYPSHFFPDTYLHPPGIIPWVLSVLKMSKMGHGT